MWIKKDRGLIVDMMYATKHYHEDNGAFMDDYRVGKSRGCGGLGIWDGKKLYTSSNYRNWKLITTGPIRSEFELTYDAWDAGNGRKVSETKRYSIDAGSWLTKAQSTFRSEDKSPLTIGVGLAERACPTGPRGIDRARPNRRLDELTGSRRTSRKASSASRSFCPKAAWRRLRMTLRTCRSPTFHAAVPQPTHEGYPPIRNLLAITQAEVGQPFTYYFGACWDRSGDFTNHIQWEDYVQTLRRTPRPAVAGDGRELNLQTCVRESDVSPLADICGSIRRSRLTPAATAFAACAIIFIASTVSAVILPHAFSATSLRSAIHEPPTAATCGRAR